MRAHICKRQESGCVRLTLCALHLSLSENLPRPQFHRRAWVHLWRRARNRRGAGNQRRQDSSVLVLQNTEGGAKLRLFFYRISNPCAESEECTCSMIAFTSSSVSVLSND